MQGLGVHGQDRGRLALLVLVGWLESCPVWLHRAESKAVRAPPLFDSLGGLDGGLASYFLGGLPAGIIIASVTFWKQ